jgi:hypothetical protein
MLRDNTSKGFFVCVIPIHCRVLFWGSFQLRYSSFLYISVLTLNSKSLSSDMGVCHVMWRLGVVIASILLLTLTAGCLEQTREGPALASSAATSVLRIDLPPQVNRTDYATFTCQLNMTRGSGLNNKVINWAIDNTYEGSSRTIWGFAAFNLTGDQTQELSIGKHVLSASFDGDYDYSASNATTTFQVSAPLPKSMPNASPTPHTEAMKPSISLSVPSTVGSGCADLTGSYSGLQRNQYLYILVKPASSNTWKVQNAPLIYANGTYAAHVCFDSQSNNDLIAIITTSMLNPGSTLNSLPQTVAESRVSTAVK